jgi:predicted AAA+ superfamily ATPase
MTINMSNGKLNSGAPIIQRILDLNNLLMRKSYFLFGPRQTGKTFLIRHTLGVRNLPHARIKKLQ